MHTINPASAGFPFGDNGSASIADFCHQTLRASLGQPLRLHPASVLARLSAGAGAAGVALDLPLADRLYGFHQHQGCGFARHRPPFGTRFAPFRVRPPVSPLTLLPAMTRSTTGNECGHETAKTRRPLVTAARWPGREAVANIRLWQAGFSWASVRPAA